MKIELKSRESSSYKKLCSSVSEARCDAELIVPDTLEDILRIICCRHQCRIREKNLVQDSVSVSGEIDVTIMYIPESGEGVRAIGTSVPFDLSFDAPGVDSTSIAVTRLISLSADAKATNPRKVSVSASVIMEQCSYKYVDVCWTEPPADAPDKLFFKTEELQCKNIVLVSEKTLSIEDELELPETLQGGDFVKAFSSITLGASEVVGTKLVVKGTAEIDAVYIVSGVPQTAKFTLPFSQLFTLPDGCSDPEVYPVSMITGQYFEAFDGKLSADIRAAIQIICLQEKNITYISDAYSCKKQLELTRSELRCLTDTREITSGRTLKLAYNSDYGADMIVSATASFAEPEKSESEILIPVMAEIVYKDLEGELRSCHVRGKAQFELQDGIQPDEINVLNISVNASAANNSVCADITVQLTMQYESYSSIDVISEVTETELDQERAKAALYMCRCTDGDLWGIAKKYGSDMELIKLINEIDGVIDDRLLLIPVI